MRNAIPYRGELIAPGSHAHFLHESGQHKALEAHMKQLHQAMVARGERKE